jgi:hypothetical protein
MQNYAILHNNSASCVKVEGTSCSAEISFLGGGGEQSLRKCLSLINQPEYFDFFGSLLTTAIVNCAKWLHPETSSFKRTSLSKNLQSAAQKEQNKCRIPGRSLS